MNSGINKFLIILIFTFGPIAIAEDKIWVLVDTKALTLSIHKGSRVLKVFKNIAIGRNSSGFKQRSGDDVTPIGHYTIGWLGKKTIYRRFFGITYPSVENAKKALIKGLISYTEFLAIERAHQEGKVPPQNTPLGGRLGIHGLGKADEQVHRAFNWTHGCIALTNQQIDQLATLIKPGTEIIIK